MTVVEVDAALTKLRKWLSKAEFVASFTIDDYPISRTARGRCKLEVDWKKSRAGWRTARTTTNKMGQWCKPHHSVYRYGLGVVVTHPEITKLGRGAAWLFIDKSGVGLHYANGENLTLAEPPHWCKPRRTEHRYSMVTRSYDGSVISGSLDRPPAVNVAEQVLEADPPALCDAYDLWERGIRQIQLDLICTVNLLREAV